MTHRGDSGALGWLRSWLLGDRGILLTRLEEEVLELRRQIDVALRRTGELQSEVHGLRGELPGAAAIEMMVTIGVDRELGAPRLRAAVEAIVAERSRAEAAPPRGVRWLPAGALALAIGMVGLGATSVGTAPRPLGALASHASQSIARPVARPVPPAPAALPAPQVVVLQQSDAGFGLGEAAIADDDLAREVRARLSRRPELAGAGLSFAVKDGWVWLRGEATADGRQAAEDALADLGPGTFIVDQLVVSSATAEQLAGR